MLTLTTDENKSTCFKFIGADVTPKSTHLISDNSSLIFTNSENNMDTCSFYSGPSDSTIMNFADSCETNGSIAYSNAGESCGSIAYVGGGESCGSIASASFSSFSSSSVSSFSSSCSYSC